MSNLNADYNMLKKTTIDYLLRLKNQETPNDIKNQFLEPYKVYLNMQIKSFLHFIFIKSKFQKKFNAKIKSLTELINKIEDYKQEIIEWYCEDSQTFNYDEFFKIFHDFCNNLIRAREVNK
jgi:hypothetical protein